MKTKVQIKDIRTNKDTVWFRLLIDHTNELIEVQFPREILMANLKKGDCFDIDFDINDKKFIKTTMQYCPTCDTDTFHIHNKLGYLARCSICWTWRK